MHKLPEIYGKPIDQQTRCVHYHSDLDIIALKFRCCGRYYPCYSCHEETAGHPAQVWPKSEREEMAVMCGNCGKEMTINAYLSSNNRCPSCQAAFNPNCNLHYHLYFEV